MQTRIQEELPRDLIESGLGEDLIAKKSDRVDKVEEMGWHFEVTDNSDDSSDDESVDDESDPVETTLFQLQSLRAEIETQRSRIIRRWFQEQKDDEESSPKIDLSIDSQQERDNMDEKKMQGKNSPLRVISPSKKNKRRKRQNDSRKASKLQLGETGTSNK